MDVTFLQIFLLVNVFIMGMLAVIAFQHARAHFRPHPPEPKKPRPAPQGGHLPPEMRERILQQSSERFESILTHSASELQHDLGETTARLNKLIEKLGTEVAKNELERFQDQLEQLRNQAHEAIGGAQSDIVAHQKELQAVLAAQREELEKKLAEEVAAEKQRLLQQMDTKLADAVTAFLLETLQHNVDLGAQTAYLTTMLEEHKAELTKEVSDA